MFISIIDLECERSLIYEENEKSTIHDVKVCIDYFLSESFSAGLMYWLLCNS